MRTGLFLGTAVAVAGIYARVRHVNPYRVSLTRVSLDLPIGAEGFDGFRILFASDFHAGPIMAEGDLLAWTAAVEDEDYDLLLLGGDYVSESLRYLHRIDPLLDRLLAHARLGGMAVLGNHDYSLSADRVATALARHGLTVLINAAVSLDLSFDRLWIVGIDDSLLGTPDLDTAFAGIQADEAKLVLWHEAVFADQIAARGAFAQLSGHSHGGQVQIPFVKPVWTPPHGRKHVSRTSIVEGMPVYTSHGIGVYRPPFRLNCPPEMTLITLKAPGNRRLAKPEQ